MEDSSIPRSRIRPGSPFALSKNDKTCQQKISTLSEDGMDRTHDLPMTSSTNLESAALPLSYIPIGVELVGPA